MRYCCQILDCYDANGTVGCNCINDETMPLSFLKLIIDAFLLRPLQWIYCIYALLLFIGIMLLLFPFILIASLFGKHHWGNFIFKICSIWGDLWFLLIGIWHRNLFETPHDKSKHYIFVANHISYLDAPIIVKTLRQPIRALGKTEMSKVPVFGFIYKYAVVRVDRSNADNRAKSVRNMRSILKKEFLLLFFRRYI
jgi:1-acyl-sn-glycerol-3-phosphate acyltransferase